MDAYITEGNVYANVDYFSSKSFYYPLLSNIVYHNTFNLQELGESVLVNSYMGSDRTKYTNFTLADTDVTYYNVLRNGDKVYSSETDAGLNVDHLFDNDSNVSGDIWSTAWYDSDGSDSVAIYEFSQGPKNITKMSFKQSPVIQTAYTGSVSIYYHNGTSFVAVSNPSAPTIQNVASSPFVITFDSVVSDKFKIVAQPASGATHAALQEWSLYASQQDFNIEELNSATISYDATGRTFG